MKLAALLVGFALAATSRPAAAQEPQQPPAVPASPSGAPPPVAQPPAAPPAATPAAPASKVYLGGRIGVFRPSDDDELDPFSFESGVDLEALVGLRLNPHLSVEAGLGYYKSSTNTLSAGGTSVDFDLTNVPFTASVRAGTEIDRVALYGLAGVGYHMTELKVNASSASFSGSISEEDDVFGFHLGAGFAFAVTPRLSLGAELRRTFVKGEYQTLLGPGGLGAPTTELTLDGLRIGATATFRR